MKVDVSEHVAAKAVATLQNTADPNVRALVRSLKAVLDRPAPLRLELDELEALHTMVELGLVYCNDAAMNATARRAVPKLLKMLQRERERAR